MHTRGGVIFIWASWLQIEAACWSPSRTARHKTSRGSTRCILTLERKKWSHVIHVLPEASRHVCFMSTCRRGEGNSATTLNNVSRTESIIWDKSRIWRCIKWALVHSGSLALCLFSIHVMRMMSQHIAPKKLCIILCSFSPLLFTDSLTHAGDDFYWTTRVNLKFFFSCCEWNPRAGKKGDTLQRLHDINNKDFLNRIFS